MTLLVSLHDKSCNTAHVQQQVFVWQKEFSLLQVFKMFIIYPLY